MGLLVALRIAVFFFLVVENHEMVFGDRRNRPIQPVREKMGFELKESTEISKQTFKIIKETLASLFLFYAVRILSLSTAGGSTSPIFSQKRRWA